MASQSFKDLFKAAKAFFSTSERLTELPDGLQEASESLRYNGTAVDEATSQKVHDELQGIYKRHVAEDDSKTAAFMQLLLAMRPFLITSAQKLFWYARVIFPILDAVGRLRVETDRASTFMLETLDYDTDDGDAPSRVKESNQFLDLLIDGYMSRTLDVTDDEPQYSLENEHIASQFESVLISFGKKKPKNMLLALDHLVVDKSFRIRALSLLTVLVRYQPPHLHHVAQTPLIGHLLQCLLIDTSSTVIQLALTTLVMFLPHIPTSVKQHLPHLFLIYSRLLCFDQVKKARTDEASDKQDDINGSEWQKQDSADGEELIPIDMIHFFTFLYGLYPLNFTSFIRKPRRYLKDIKFPRAEQLNLDQDLVRARTAPFQEKHLLHESFYKTTAEEELEEDQFLHKDAAEVVASCIGLVNNVPSGLLRTASDISLDFSRRNPKLESIDIPADSLLADDASTIAESIVSVNDSIPALGASRKSPLDQLQHQKSRYSLTSPPALMPRAISRPELNDKTTVALPDAAMSLDEVISANPSTAFLQRKILLLRGNLQYERYLKSQHLSHIGELQRRLVMDATLMANLESQMSLNKTLKSQLAKANNSYAALKRETFTGRAQSKEFELKLTSRVRGLRDSEKQWNREREELTLDLNRTKNDNYALRKLVVEAEARELLSRQKMASNEFELERARDMQKRFKDMETQVKGSESIAWEKEAASVEHQRTRMKVEQLNMRLRSQQSESDKMHGTLTQQIRELRLQPSPSAQNEQIQSELTERVRKANQVLVGRFAALQDENAALRGHVRGLTALIEQQQKGMPHGLDDMTEVDSDDAVSSESRETSPALLTSRRPSQTASSAPARENMSGKGFVQRTNAGQEVTENSDTLHQQRKATRSSESLAKAPLEQVEGKPVEVKQKKKKSKRGIRGFM